MKKDKKEKINAAIEKMLQDEDGNALTWKNLEVAMAHYKNFANKREFLILSLEQQEAINKMLENFNNK